MDKASGQNYHGLNRFLEAVTAAMNTTTPRPPRTG